MLGGVGGLKADAALPDAVALVVAVHSGRRWALPLASVDRVVAMVEVTDLPQSPAGLRGAINVHGEIVGVLDLDARLGTPGHRPGLGGRLLLARTSRRRVALAVDEVLGVIELDAAAIEPPPEAMPATIAGVAALDDGLLVICDLDAFLTPGDDDAAAAALARAGL